MIQNKDKRSLQDMQEIQTLLHAHFPDTKIDSEAITTAQIDNGEILFKPEQILPYLQTIFFEEHLLELQFDQSTRSFFTNLLDDTPDPATKDEADMDDDTEYEAGSYLKETDSFLISPLSPGIGNARIRSCNQIVVRFYMGTSAVELGCTFRCKDLVDGIPVLRLNFPEIGRIDRNYRAFRVKVVSGVAAHIAILRPMLADITEATHQLDDISTMGLAFHVFTTERSFKTGDEICFNIQVPDTEPLEVEGTIRHISNARNNQGFLKICGVQFDLETRSLATDIERIAASVQRLQLREIAEKTASMRGVQLIK